MKCMQAVSVWGMGCAIVLMAGCGGQQPLKIHFPEGFERTYEVRESTETEMSIPVLNEGMRQANRTDSTLRIAVDEPSAEGPAKMAVTIEDAGGSMSMSFMGETMKFEGDGDDNPMAQFAKAVIGEEYRVTVEPNGNIVSFEGLDAIFDKVLASQGIGALSRDEIAAYMKELWSVEQERLSMQKCVFPRLPVTGVERGSTWTVTYTVTYPLPMAIEDTYTVLNVYDDRVTIDVASVLTPHPTESSIDFGAEFSMNLDVNGTGEGFIEVDRATGWINEASTTMRIRGEAEMRGMPIPMPGGMGKMPMTARYEISSKAI